MNARVREENEDFFVRIERKGHTSTQMHQSKRPPPRPGESTKLDGYLPERGIRFCKVLLGACGKRYKARIYVAKKDPEESLRVIQEGGTPCLGAIGENGPGILALVNGGLPRTVKREDGGGGGTGDSAQNETIMRAARKEKKRTMYFKRWKKRKRKREKQSGTRNTSWGLRARGRPPRKGQGREREKGGRMRNSPDDQVKGDV